MVVSSIDQYGNVYGDGQVSVTTAPQSLRTLMDQGGEFPANFTRGSQFYGFEITNCEAAGGATIYLAFSGTPSATRYYRSLAPGASVRINAGPGVLDRMIVVGTGACTPYTVVLG